MKKLYYSSALVLSVTVLIMSSSFLYKASNILSDVKESISYWIGTEEAEEIVETAPLMMDADGDGILDLDDDDDDNDGIPDCVEKCAQSTTFFLNSSTMGYGNNNVTNFPAQFNDVNGIIGLNVRYDVSGGYQSGAGNGVNPRLSPNGTYLNWKRAGQTNTLNVAFNGSVKPVQLRINSENNMFARRNIPNYVYNERIVLGVNYVGKNATSSRYRNGCAVCGQCGNNFSQISYGGTPPNNHTYVMPVGGNGGTTNSRNSCGFVSLFDECDGINGFNYQYDSPASRPQPQNNEANQLITDIRIKVCFDDFDNDGVPNHLDTDSDNDGCPDAIEAGGSYNTGDLDAMGRIDITQYPVDGNGVPSGTRQTLDLSQDSSMHVCLFAVNDTFSTPHDTNLSGNITGNDVDGNSQAITVLSDALIDLDNDGIPETPMTIDNTPYTIPGVGVITIDPSTGNFLFDPELGFVGRVPVIEYEATDPDGNTDKALLIIDVTPVLPVQLVKFDVREHNGHAIISWSTAQEVDNSHYLIECSADGKSYKALGKVVGNSTTNKLSTYGFTDKSPKLGVNYYRLTQVDIDGQSETFAPKVLFIEGNKVEVSIYPNPVLGGKVFLSSNASLKNHTAEVFTLSGQRVTKSLILNDESLDVRSLSAGTYFVSIKNETNEIISMNKLIIK